MELGERNSEAIKDQESPRKTRFDEWEFVAGQVRVLRGL